MEVSGKYCYYCGPCFLFMVMGLLYFSQGIDHTITTMVISFISAGIALLGFYLIGLVFRQKPLYIDGQNK